jgi:hypothetical protein
MVLERGDGLVSAAVLKVEQEHDGTDGEGGGAGW